MNVVVLTYGHGFACNEYFMEVNNSVFKIGWSEEEARESAKAILKEKFPEVTVDIDKMPFKWDGTL